MSGLAQLLLEAEQNFTLLLQVRKEIAYWSGDKEN